MLFKKMKKQAKRRNDFAREYFDPMRVTHWNRIKPTGTSYEHYMMVSKVCWWLYKNGIDFCTEAKFKTGYEPDIVCPNHIRPIIEVRFSETDKETMSKFVRIPDELQNQIIYVDADKEFEEELIL